MTLAETSNQQYLNNPLLNLPYEPALESLGDDYYDEVAAEEFPLHTLRWRNNSLLSVFGLEPEKVTDEDFITAFGKFAGRTPFLALCYHGYQFGEYNSRLGDGRGFLYGQVRGTDGELYDFGTKGSGRTPYSRGGDGMLTLKGGVREVLAGEMLHRMGVRTSRSLSLVETGLKLWRGDEPSPTRSCVMIRMNRSHIRFGTFERLHYLKRPDLTQNLLNHVIEQYYQDLVNEADKYALFYAQLVKRVAQLVAQWIAAGFCHAVLNTDNMSITGESFDYGPYAFIPKYDPYFTAAYFDYYKRYCYSHQPGICKLNLELLQKPLEAIIPKSDMETALETFDKHYRQHYDALMVKKLGFEDLSAEDTKELVGRTIEFLKHYPVSYHDFFADLRSGFTNNWRDDASLILSESLVGKSLGSSELFLHWTGTYHRILSNVSTDEMVRIAENLKKYNPLEVIVRPVIEEIWDAIAQKDNWQPFYDFIQGMGN
ncbi:MAG: YdiU family protein [Cyanobacteria bacterium P01_A01_bin.45]